MFKSTTLISAMIVSMNLLAGCGGDSTGPEKPKASKGALSVSVTTSGPDQDADGYVLKLDGQSEQPADTSGTVQFEELTEGSHTVDISDISPSCAVDGEATKIATVSAGDTTSLSFQVRCKPALIKKIVFSVEQSKSSKIFALTPVKDSTEEFPADSLLKLAGSGNPVHPDVFSDGTRVVYENEGNIWIVNADGNGEKQLTDSGEDHAPSACPDGRIVFTSRRDSISQLYVMQGDGSGQTAIDTKNPIYEASCPEGSKSLSKNSGPVVAARMGDGSKSEIVLVDISASGDKRMTQLTDNDYYNGDPSWSFDGKNVVCVILKEKGVPNLATLDAETGKIKEQSNFESNFLDENASPSFSPDDKWILFTSLDPNPGPAGASDYNASRSNRTYNNGIIDDPFGGGSSDGSVKHAVYSPRWK